MPLRLRASRYGLGLNVMNVDEQMKSKLLTEFDLLLVLIDHNPRKPRDVQVIVESEPNTFGLMV